MVLSQCLSGWLFTEPWIQGEFYIDFNRMWPKKQIKAQEIISSIQGKDCNSHRSQLGKRFSPITYRKVFEKKKCAFRAKEMEHLFFLAPGCLKILTVEKCTF